MGSTTKKYKLKRVITGGLNNTTTYWGKFTYNKKDGSREDITLTETFDVIRGSEPIGGKRVFKVAFKNAHYEHDIIIDVENHQQMLFLDNMMLDPKVHSKGLLSTGHLWHLVDENYEALQLALEIKKRANVTSKIYSMSKEELSKLCYYLNVNIIGKSREAVLGILLHPITGAIFKIPLQAENNHMDFILSEAFGSDFDIKSTVNKAVVLGLITERNGTYYLSESSTILGASIDSVYAFFKDNHTTYNLTLVPLVAKHDSLPESIDYSNELKSVSEQVDADNKSQPVTEEGKLTPERRTQLENRAKELNIVGNIKNFGDETLVRKITDAETKAANKLT